MTTTNDMKQSNILLNQMKQLKITLVGENTFHFASNQAGCFTNNLFIFIRGMNFRELLVVV